MKKTTILLAILALVASSAFAMSDNGDGTRTFTVGTDFATVADIIWVHPAGVISGDTLNISGDLSAQSIDISATGNSGTITITGSFKLSKITGNAGTSFVGSGARVTGPLELGANVKLSRFVFVHE